MLIPDRPFCDSGEDRCDEVCRTKETVAGLVVIGAKGSSIRR
jgi:hypothetical protein